MKPFSQSISGRFFLILFGLLLLPLLIPLGATFFFQFDSVRQDVAQQLAERTSTVERLMVEQELSFASASRYVEQSVIETTEVSADRLQTWFHCLKLKQRRFAGKEKWLSPEPFRSARFIFGRSANVTWWRHRTRTRTLSQVFATRPCLESV